MASSYTRACSSAAARSPASSSACMRPIAAEALNGSTATTLRHQWTAAPTSRVETALLLDPFLEAAQPGNEEPVEKWSLIERRCHSGMASSQCGLEVPQVYLQRRRIQSDDFSGRRYQVVTYRVSDTVQRLLEAVARVLGVALRPQECQQLVARQPLRAVPGEEGEQRQQTTPRGGFFEGRAVAFEGETAEEGKAQHWEDGRRRLTRN